MSGEKSCARRAKLAHVGKMLFIMLAAFGMSCLITWLFLLVMIEPPPPELP